MSVISELCFAPLKNLVTGLATKEKLVEACILLSLEEIAIMITKNLCVAKLFRMHVR